MNDDNCLERYFVRISEGQGIYKSRCVAFQDALIIEAFGGESTAGTRDYINLFFSIKYVYTSNTAGIKKSCVCQYCTLVAIIKYMVKSQG